MPVYDNNGAVNAAIGKIYDNNGTANTVIQTVYDNDGTVNRLIHRNGYMLYDYGDPCVELCGGWKTSRPDPAACASYFELASNCMRYNNLPSPRKVGFYEYYLETNSKPDFSPFTMVRVEYAFSAIGTGYSLCELVTNTKRITLNAATTARQTVDIPVASSTAYIRFEALSYAAPTEPAYTVSIYSMELL